MIKTIVNMFRGLTCYHDDLQLVKKSDWFPTFETTNGLADEDERILTLTCTECSKRFERKQFKSSGQIMNYREFQ